LAQTPQKQATGKTMQGEILFKSEDIEITPKVARFKNSSYQVANIDSVSLEKIGRMNLAAIVVLCFGLSALLSGLAVKFYFFGFRLGALGGDGSGYFLGIGITLALVALGLQLIWPRWCHTLWLKTSSGNVEALVSDDEEQVSAVRRALERAFLERQ
jgi:hypothetical protein